MQAMEGLVCTSGMKETWPRSQLSATVVSARRRRDATQETNEVKASKKGSCSLVLWQ